MRKRVQGGRFLMQCRSLALGRLHPLGQVPRERLIDVNLAVKRKRSFCSGPRDLMLAQMLDPSSLDFTLGMWGQGICRGICRIVGHLGRPMSDEMIVSIERLMIGIIE